MLRQALAEVRLHPGRFVSTLIAIAISVAFLAGSATLVATEAGAQARSVNLPIALADLVVDQAGVAGMRQALAGVGGVAAVAPVLQLNEAVTNGDSSQVVNLYLAAPRGLQWAKLSKGRWPEAANEVALSSGSAAALHVTVGQSVLTANEQQALDVVGITDEPNSLFFKTGYASAERFEQYGYDLATVSQWAVRAADGVDAASLLPGVEAAARALASEATTELATTVRARAATEVTGGFDAFTYLLWSFAAVALVVGMITISNTFAITLAQRRRQIGLLRAVGASGAQVRRRFLAEALALGVIGSLGGLVLGLAIVVAVTAWSGSLFWGLEVPLAQVVPAVAVGVLATVVAAWVPIVRGTRVHPLEALQPVAGAEEARRSGVVRAVVCGLLAVSGAVLSAMAVTGQGFGVAVVAGLLLAMAVLFGAPLYVPGLLRLTGGVLSRLGTVAGLAARNAARNPRRATSTATALMLAVGLIVTLQVATASLRTSMVAEIEATHPVDLSLAWTDPETGSPAPVPEAARRQFAAIPGVSRWILLDAGTGSVRSGDDEWGFTLLGYDPSVPLVTGSNDAPRADQILLDAMVAEQLPKQVNLVGERGSAKLTVVASPLAEGGWAMVSASVLKKVAKPVPDAMAWLSVPDHARAVDATVAANRVAGTAGQVGGSVAQAAILEQILDLLLAITTALLGVAVLIALVGVSNTLGLSVLERSRESALLRALGLQARSLRTMLTVEALQVTLIGVMVGVVAGVYFGWLAVASLAWTANLTHVSLAVDLPQTLALLGLAVLAAGLASVLPGRRAARAVPTEALADT